MDAKKQSGYFVYTGDTRRCNAQTDKNILHVVQYTSGRDGLREDAGRNTTIHAGVGIVIRNELLHYVDDIQPLGERLMSIKLKAIVPVYIFTAYAPTAMAEERDKDRFYKELETETQLIINKGILITQGDFNARIRGRISEDETVVGNYTLDARGNTDLDMTDAVLDNRNRFVGYAMETQQMIMNTCFYKRGEYLITYKEDKAHPGGHRMTPGSMTH